MRSSRVERDGTECRWRGGVFFVIVDGAVVGLFGEAAAFRIRSRCCGRPCLTSSSALGGPGLGEQITARRGFRLHPALPSHQVFHLTEEEGRYFIAFSRGIPGWKKDVLRFLEFFCALTGSGMNLARPSMTMPSSRATGTISDSLQVFGVPGEVVVLSHDAGVDVFIDHGTSCLLLPSWQLRIFL